MNIDDTVKLLTDAGHVIADQKRLPNDTGWQLRLDKGAVVNVWDKGSFNVQGKNTEEMNALEARGQVLHRHIARGVRATDF